MTSTNQYTYFSDNVRSHHKKMGLSMLARIIKKIVQDVDLTKHEKEVITLILKPKSQKDLKPAQVVSYGEDGRLPKSIDFKGTLADCELHIALKDKYSRPYFSIETLGSVDSKYWGKLEVE